MDEHREALSKEYGEVCNSFRTLTDIRFRTCLIPENAGFWAGLERRLVL
jgi:hypothetical protein